MIDESQWINDFHGLELDPGFKEGARGNENGILFLAEYYLLKYLLGELQNTDIVRFKLIVENITTRDKDGNKIKGLYDRGAGESMTIPPEDRRTISHDNLTAISLFSQLVGLEYSTHIADMLISSQGRFDNVHPDKMKWHNFMMHPRDWFAWLNASEKRWHRTVSWLFFPVYCLAAIEDVLVKEKCRPVWYERWLGLDKAEKRCYLDTSGPLLWFIRHEVLSRKSRLCKILYWLCKKGYKRTFGKNWIAGAMGIYFKNIEHPNRILSKKLK